MSFLMPGLRNAGFAFAASSMFAACAAEPPKPLLRENTVQLTATITAVDVNTRFVSLRDSAGRTATVYAGTEVRNLAQVKVGDVVSVNYYEAIGAEVTSPKKSSPQSTEQQTSTTRTPIGDRPGGAVGQVTTATVEIDSVDTSSNTVTFRRDDGTMRTIAIQNPDSLRFVRALKHGDQVQVSYTEAIAISVQPTG